MLYYPKEALGDADHVVVVPQYQGKWFFIRRAKQKSITFPSGKRKEGESLTEAAQRVLREESGAAEFSLWPVSFYGAVQESRSSAGQLFFASITRLASLQNPHIDTHCLIDEPEDMVYRTVQLRLMERVKKWQMEKRTLLYLLTAAGIKREKLTKTMEGCYLDGIYAYADREIRAALAPLAKERQMAVQVNDDFGEEGAALFKRQGLAVFDAVCEGEDGCSVALGVHWDFMQAILDRYKAFLHVDLLAMMQMYESAPGMRRGPLADRHQEAIREAGAVRLVLIDDVLIGAESTWKKGS